MNFYMYRLPKRNSNLDLKNATHKEFHTERLQAITKWAIYWLLEWKPDEEGILIKIFKGKVEMANVPNWKYLGYILLEDGSNKTRRGRPHCKQTLHRIAPPLCPKNKNKKVNMWHVTRDTWYVTCDTWHVTCDTWREVNILSKLQVPRSYGLEGKVSWRFGGKGLLI